MHNVPPAHRSAPSLIPRPVASGFGFSVVRNHDYQEKVENLKILEKDARNNRMGAEQRYRQSVQTEDIAKELTSQALKRSNAARVKITECKDQAKRVREYCAVLIKQKDEKIKQLQQQRSQGQAKVNALSNENTQVKSENEAVEVSSQELRRQVEEAEQRCGKKDERIKQLTEQLSQAQVEVNALSKENTQVKSEKEAAVVTIQDLRGKLEEAKQGGGIKDLEIIDLYQKIAKYEKCMYQWMQYKLDSEVRHNQLVKHAAELERVNAQLDNYVKEQLTQRSQKSRIAKIAHAQGTVGRLRESVSAASYLSR